MTEEQLDVLRQLIKLEIELVLADGMDHGSWGWIDRQIDEGWKELKNSFKSS